ncbi:MAG: hypothetical protein GC201_06605 [Alphaproteobacteria bacterium]|nr:hypothetical protein [Alphaproteobacteria bacterium]
MFRRIGIWLALAALLQSLLPVGLASARPADTGPTTLSICTLNGIVHVALPGADQDQPRHPDNLPHSASCFGCCPCTHVAPLAEPLPPPVPRAAWLNLSQRPARGTPAASFPSLAAQPRGPPSA